MVIVQQSAEARPTGDLAICPVVIRRTDVPDDFATDALVKTLGHVVLDEFLDQVAQMSLAENHKVIQALVLESGRGPARWCAGRPLAVSAVFGFVPV